ncbi:hypothetical protein [Acaryochloris sp. IP29b_bin.137]|uniref:hypothetical protein n=1 Tax=Acaryochloris sp. IP29b_bin.137 TaxID=2969217 RepID=UPI00260AE1E0|nr:hypothetical protein [Acaryochloris sp. IP29b_bin.137]
MKESTIFVSVGGTATDQQELFVRAVEDRLRSESLVPRTVGRNTFSSEAPLKAINKLMDSCSGIVVIALERTYFSDGLEKRGGPNESILSEVRLPTSWNQIEAAMAYSKGLPLLVIIENGLKSEGLLEKGYDWYVQWVNLHPTDLNTPEFNGVLASWKEKLDSAPEKKHYRDPSKLTIAELIGSLKPVQFWSVLLALSALVAGAFTLGGKLNGLDKINGTGVQQVPVPSNTP